MNKRVLILTGASDILYPNESPSYVELSDKTLASKERYAKKHGYDIMTLRSFGSDFKFGFSDTNVGHLRAIRAFESLEYYDIVMWVDADAVITNENLAISEFPIQEDVIFYASYDWMGRGSFSTGNFILQRTNQINEFFNVFLQISKQTNDEQHAFNIMYAQTPLRSIMRVLDWGYLNAVPSQVMESSCWRDRQRISYSWKPGDFLAHLTGITIPDRFDILEKHFKEYL